MLRRWEESCDNFPSCSSLCTVSSMFKDESLKLLLRLFQSLDKRQDLVVIPAWPGSEEKIEAISG